MIPVFLFLSSLELRGTTIHVQFNILFSFARLAQSFRFMIFVFISLHRLHVARATLFLSLLQNTCTTFAYDISNHHTSWLAAGFNLICRQLVSQMSIQTPATLATTSSRRSFLGRRFSRASVLSFASVNTVLPQYNAVDDSSLDDQSVRSSPIASLTEAPPRYSPRDSSLVTNHSPVESSESVPCRSPDLELLHGFKYSYPIKSDKPWATLHLYTRHAEPGNSKPLKSRPKVPRLWGCDPVVGTLELELDVPQTIQHIKIMVSHPVQSFSQGFIYNPRCARSRAKSRPLLWVEVHYLS